MKHTWKARAGLALLAMATVLGAGSQALAQRPKGDATAPAATGKVVAYDAGKSLTVEVKQRGGLTKKVEFVIVKDKTKVELVGRTKAIEVGTEVKVWADKDDAKTAVRILAGAVAGGAGADAPTAAGKVVAYEVAQAITVEVPQRGGLTKKVEFAIVKDKTKVELLGTIKAIEVGTEVRIWADKDDAKIAARIAAGAAGGGRARKPPVPKVDPPKKPDEPAKVTPPPPPKRDRSASTAEAPVAVARAIDQDIQRVLDKEAIRASAKADDAEFLRRVYLDITGKIPTPDKAVAFLDSKD